MRPGLSSPLVEHRTGDSFQTVIDLPSQLASSLEITYNSTVRVTIGTSSIRENVQTHPQRPLLISLKLVDCGRRCNEVQLTSNTYVPLPRKIVTALGLRGCVDWLRCDEKLIGRLTEYHSGSLLYNLASEYTEVPIPTHDPWEADRRPQTTFELLQRVATTPVKKGFPITKSEGGTFLAHTPNCVRFSEGDIALFTVSFVEGRFSIALTSPDDVLDYKPLVLPEGSVADSAYAGTLTDHHDLVVFTRTEQGDLAFPIPAQVAQTVWLEDGYTQDWFNIGQLAISQLSPNDPETARAANLFSDTDTAPE